MWCAYLGWTGLPIFSETCTPSRTTSIITSIKCGSSGAGVSFRSSILHILFPADGISSFLHILHQDIGHGADRFHCFFGQDLEGSVLGCAPSLSVCYLGDILCCFQYYFPLVHMRQIVKILHRTNSNNYPIGPIFPRAPLALPSFCKMIN